MGIIEKMRQARVKRRREKLDRKREAEEAFKATALFKEMETMQKEMAEFYDEHSYLTGDIAKQIADIHRLCEKTDEELKDKANERIETMRQKIIHLTEGHRLKNNIDHMRKEYDILKSSNLWPKNKK